MTRLAPRALFLSFSLTILSSAWTLSCSSSDASAAGEDGGEADSGVVGCESSPMAEVYSADMVHAGAQGKYEFTLTAATPAPPGQFANAWTMKIVDASGKTPAIADIAVVPRMPLMNHGSDQTPQLQSNADGTIGISDIYLFMPGLWTVTFTVSANGSSVDSAVFGFCIP
jgi:hypothetical protein